MTSTYTVETGWVRSYRCGDRVEERYCDSPTQEFFDSREQAEAYLESEAADLALLYRVERQCAGRGWVEETAYANLQAWEELEDEDGEPYVEGVEVLDERRYGLEEWERDHAEK